MGRKPARMGTLPGRRPGSAAAQNRPAAAAGSPPVQYGQAAHPAPESHDQPPSPEDLAQEALAVYDALMAGDERQPGIRSRAEEAFRAALLERAYRIPLHLFIRTYREHVFRPEWALEREYRQEVLHAVSTGAPVAAEILEESLPGQLDPHPERIPLARWLESSLRRRTAELARRGGLRLDWDFGEGRLYTTNLRRAKSALAQAAREQPGYSWRIEMDMLLEARMAAGGQERYSVVGYKALDEGDLERMRGELAAVHREAVRAALGRGEHLGVEVLGSYPELLREDGG